MRRCSKREDTSATRFFIFVSQVSAFQFFGTIATSFLILFFIVRTENLCNNVEWTGTYVAQSVRLSACQRLEFVSAQRTKHEAVPV